MKGIYVASRASISARPAMWRAYRDAGWPIVSTWIDEAGPGQTADLGELWERIGREVRGSCGVVLYAEPGDFPLHGALVEVGMALGAGLPVAVVAPGTDDDWTTSRKIGSWVLHPRVETYASVEDAMEALIERRAEKAPRGPCGMLHHAHDCECEGAGGDR